MRGVTGTPMLLVHVAELGRRCIKIRGCVENLLKLVSSVD